MKTLVFTGGHHTSALAVIDALKGQYQVFFLGHRYSMHGERAESAEYREVTARAIPFFDLKAGKVYRTFSLIEWLRVPFGFFQSLWVLLKIRPDLIVSFGGYLAVPVVLAGWFFRIPVVTHEQTVVSGWANRFIAKFAQKIFISWRGSEKFFPKEKVVLTGLPLRKEIVALAKEIRRHRDTEIPKYRDEVRGVPHTVYITGGKQGSQVINRAIEGCLSGLLSRFEVIHQCGALDLEKFLEIENGLPEDPKARYIVKDYFPQEEIPHVYRACDFVVGRAGAHTVYELAALGKPGVLIPIPWASHHEQQRNAEILERIGLVKILPQSELSPKTFLRYLREVGENTEVFREAGRKARKLVRLDAAQKIAEEILAILA